MKTLEVSKNLLQTFKMEKMNLDTSETSGDFNKMFLEMQNSTQQKLDEMQNFHKKDFSESTENNKVNDEVSGTDCKDEITTTETEIGSETKSVEKDSERSEKKSSKTKKSDEQKSDEKKIKDSVKVCEKVDANDKLLKSDSLQKNEKQNETKLSDETKVAVQSKLKEIASVKNYDELDEKLNELSELLNITFEQLSDLLGKQKINIEEVKAALEEGNNDTAKKQLLNLVLKLSDISVKLEENGMKNFSKKIKNTDKNHVLKNEASEEIKKDVSLEKTDLFESNSKVESDADGSLTETEKEGFKEGKIKLGKLNPTKRFEPVNKRVQSKVIESIKAGAAKTIENVELNSKSQIQSETVKQQVSGQTNNVDSIKAAFSGNIKVNQNVNRVNGNVMKTEMLRNQIFKTSFDAGVKTTKTDSDKGSMKNFSGNQNSGQNFGNLNTPRTMNQKFANLVRTATPTTNSYSSIQYKQTFEQMIKSIKFMNEADKSQMEIKLKPGNLGNLKIDVTMGDQGGIVAKFVSDNEQTRQIIESNISQLKTALEEQGLKIEGFEVSVRQETNSETNQNSSNFNAKKGSKKLSGVNAMSATKEEILVEQNEVKDYVDNRYSTFTYVA